MLGSYGWGCIWEQGLLHRRSCYMTTCLVLAGSSPLGKVKYQLGASAASSSWASFRGARCDGPLTDLITVVGAAHIVDPRLRASRAKARKSARLEGHLVLAGCLDVKAAGNGRAGGREGMRTRQTQYAVASTICKGQAEPRCAHRNGVKQAPLCVVVWPAAGRRSLRYGTVNSMAGAWLVSKGIPCQQLCAGHTFLVSQSPRRGCGHAWCTTISGRGSPCSGICFQRVPSAAAALPTHLQR